MDTITLDIVTPYGTVYSGQVDEVSASGSEGDFGVLAGHAPYMTALKIGAINTRIGSAADSYFVSGGFAEVGPDKVTVLAESAEHATAIDVERALEAKKRAEERLTKAEQIDFKRAELALSRALTRIGIAETRRK